MAAVLIVNEIKSERQELARALEAEGFQVIHAESAAEAVREIWEGTFLCVFIAAILTGTKSNQLSEEIHQMAPEVETFVHGKNDNKSTLVRKAVDLRDGVAAA
ncbi:response regulator [Haliangium ochraceum]|uniref:Response regulator receiver protein n=1 Tax=Haliangium ochraceum (strain DSM 14365 / JCM 11303 / SMP-2) TaxID=502025 RepID=D0LYA7_HALO1|nr:response regulator [Haliangium ochraceum]ACY16257.1 response regulator receiver protein [Haliangium ochraceum DSM 14365]